MNELDKLINCRMKCNRQDYPLYEKIFKNEVFLKKFDSNLEKFQIFLSSSNINLNKLCEYQNQKCSQNFKFETLKKNFQTLTDSIDTQKLFQKSYIKSKNFDQKIETGIKNKYFEIVRNLIFVRSFSNGEVRLFNLTPFDLEINNIFFYKKNCENNCSLKIKKKILLPKSNFEYSKVQLNLDLKDYESIQFDISYNLKKIKSSKFEIEDEKYFVAKNQKIYDFKNLDIIENNIIIKEGVTEIDNPLILPENYNLKIFPGSKIVFKKDAYISVNGGNIEAIGGIL